MNYEEFEELHKAIDKIPDAEVKENGWTLIPYTEVSVAIDKIYEKFNRDENNYIIKRIKEKYNNIKED